MNILVHLRFIGGYDPLKPLALMAEEIKCNLEAVQSRCYWPQSFSEFRLLITCTMEQASYLRRVT